jgi:bifunctional non-homologous end joining protein LigD
MFTEDTKFYAIAPPKAKLFVMISALVSVYNFSEIVMNEAKKFVVQRHERQNKPTHWDLMLESGGILETYRIGEPPEQWGISPIEAARIFDHPLKFLTYEGSVNEGKGSVKIADRGAYRVVSQNENRLILEISGAILKGEFTFATGECRARRE